MKLSFIEQHIIDCVRAAIAEAGGDEKKAARLRAQSKLRLICMTDEEIWELAEQTCCPPQRTAIQAYGDLKRTIIEYKETSDKWIDLTYGGIAAAS